MVQKATRDYKREYENYQGSEQQKHNRALRNAARRHAVETGQAYKGDGMDVDHITPLSKGGANVPSNERVITKGANRSFPRTSTGALKSNT